LYATPSSDEVGLSEWLEPETDEQDDSEEIDAAIDAGRRGWMLGSGPRCASVNDWDAGVTQNLPTLPKLTSLTVLAVSHSITYVAATCSGKFSLQVRLPQTFLLHCVVPPTGTMLLNR